MRKSSSKSLPLRQPEPRATPRLLVVPWCELHATCDTCSEAYAACRTRTSICCVMRTETSTLSEDSQKHSNFFLMATTCSFPVTFWIRAHPVQLLIQRALWAAVQETKQAPMHGGGSPGAGFLWRGLDQEEAGGKAVIRALNDDGDRAEMIVGSRAQARSRGASPHRARGCWCPACRVGTHLARQQVV